MAPCQGINAMRRSLVGLALLAWCIVGGRKCRRQPVDPSGKSQGVDAALRRQDIEGWMRSDGKPSNHGVEQSSINPHRCGAYMMVYDKEFSNFELQCDYKVTVLCNSGIFVRTFPLTPNGSVGYNGIEIAIQDGIKEGYHATGAFTTCHPSSLTPRSPPASGITSTLRATRISSPWSSTVSK